MTRGSKFDRCGETRAARSVRLLISINEMRRIGCRRGTPEEQAALDRQEDKLRQLDEIHGYDHVGWALFNRDPSVGVPVKQDTKALDAKNATYARRHSP